MTDQLARYRIHVLLLLMLAVPTSSLVLARGGHGRGPLDRVAISGVGELQVGGFLGFEFFDDLWRDYVALQDLKDENTRLRSEVARLREERARLVGVLQENDRLRGLLEFKEARPELKLRPARVIGKDVSPYFRVLRVKLDAKTADFEVKPQMAVISHEGVVGQVIETYEGYADVMLVSDARSRVDVISQRNRARAMVKGKGHRRDYEADLSYLDAKDEVKTGDVLVTSGKGGTFPSEVIVGQITSIENATFQTSQTAVVTPVVDFGRLEEVFVVTNPDAASRRF